MNPWDIIGWGLLALLAVYLAVMIAIPSVVRLCLMLGSVRVPPVEGQVWDMAGGCYLEILGVNIEKKFIAYKVYQSGRRNTAYSTGSVETNKWWRVKLFHFLYLDSGPRKVSHAPQEAR